jgi:hypothetical protein
MTEKQLEPKAFPLWVWRKLAYIDDYCTPRRYNYDHYISDVEMTECKVSKKDHGVGHILRGKNSTIWGVPCEMFKTEGMPHVKRHLNACNLWVFPKNYTADDCDIPEKGKLFKVKYQLVHRNYPSLIRHDYLVLYGRYNSEWVIGRNSPYLKKAFAQLGPNETCYCYIETIERWKPTKKGMVCTYDKNDL